MDQTQQNQDKVTLVAADIIRQQQLSVSYRRYDPESWPLAPDQDQEKYAAFRDIFPPDNLVGAHSTQEVMHRLVERWDNYQKKPLRYVGYTPSEALAEIVDIPHIDGADIERMVYDPQVKMSYDLAYRMDYIFGLEGALVQYAVSANPHDPHVMDVPFKMTHRYDSRVPRDHAALLLDIYDAHHTYGGDLCRMFKVNGLRGDVLNHIVTHALAPDLFNDSKEIILGRGISRQFDMVLFNQKEGPFTRYYDWRAAQQDDDPFYAYEFALAPIRRYQDVFPHAERVGTYTVKQESLRAVRDAFYDNISDIDGTKRHALDMAQDTKIRLSTLMGWTAPHKRDAYHIARQPFLSEAGLERITERAVAPDHFIAPEERQDYFTLSEIKTNFMFADQTKKTWSGFVSAAERHIFAVYEQIKDVTDVNAETALCRSFYPTTRDNPKTARDTLYITGALYDSWVKHGVLVHKPR